jgi:thioredoxin-related protein
VIAVGLENDEVSWNIEAAKLEKFEHAISLGKWESEYAALYNIQSTPTYFILDENKYIIAKPENVNDVVSFLGDK